MNEPEKPHQPDAALHRRVTVEEIPRASSSDDPESSLPPAPTPPIPSAPPTTAGERSMPPRKRTWHIVLGIAMVTVGGFGILANGFGVFAPMAGAEFAAMPGVPGAAEMMEVMNAYRPWLHANAIIGLILAFAVLFAGIGMIIRRRWARPVSLIWAVLIMPAVMLEAWLAIQMQDAQFQVMSQQQGAPAGMMQVMGDVTKMFTVVFTMIIGWTLPLIILFWLNRKKVKQDIATW